MILSVKDISPGLFKSLPKLHRKQGNPKSRDTKWYYKDCICAFDIETTRWKYGETKTLEGKTKNLEYSIMYIWQFQIGLDITVIGRTWEEFKTLISYIDKGLELDERIVIYVHNLSYEWQFIRDLFILGTVIDNYSVFLLASRKVLRFMALNNKLEFRCSYIHSNMSLDEYTSKMKVQHRKLSGEEFDYNKIRYPWTPMTQREIEYCVNDVIGLVEALTVEMGIDGDNLYSIPLTSTGYVRRDIREAIREGLPPTWAQERKPDYETYKLLREAFRGGNTHASRFNSDFIVSAGEYRISEYDRSSSYPDVQLNRPFPITRFTKPRKVDAELFRKTIEQGYAVVARVQFTKFRVKDISVNVPYVSKDKCQHYKNLECEQDNGRILYADSVEMTVTDLDLKIIVKQYVFSEFYVIDYRFATYGQIPECIKEVIRDYYRQKTELKGNKEKAVQYVKAKNKLNSIYGNSAQDAGKMGVLYRDKDGKTQYFDGYYNRKDGTEELFESAFLDDTISKREAFQRDRERIEEITRLIYEHSSNVLPYQFGVWTTAWARYELQEMIDRCGDNFLYCDTDSVYFFDEGSTDFTEYNERKIAASSQSGAYADDANGKRHYMGVAECERDDIVEFKTLGAKKYTYITTDGKLHVTTSGVVKSKAPGEIMKEFYENPMKYKSPLDVYSLGFTFEEAGGTEIEYIDDSPGWMEIDGHALYVPSCAVIRDSTYTLSLGRDYAELLDNPYFLAAGDLFFAIESGLPYDLDLLK